MNGDEVGGGEQLVEANILDSERGEYIPRDERIVGEYLETERLRLRRRAREGYCQSPRVLAFGP